MENLFTKKLEHNTKIKNNRPMFFSDINPIPEPLGMKNDLFVSMDTPPTEDGYYFVLYYHKEYNGWYYKSLWFDSKIGFTASWDWAWYIEPHPYDSNINKITHYPIVVSHYMPSSHAQYYTESQEKANA